MADLFHLNVDVVTESFRYFFGYCQLGSYEPYLEMD